MAEVLATMMVGPLLSMVKEKASSYLLEQYKVMEGMEKNHEILKRKLPAILDVITDAEEQAAKHREGAKSWLEALRKVAYQANDLFDEFKYEALRREAKEKGQYKQVGMDVIKLFPSYSRTVFRCRMGNKLHMILNEIEVLITEMNAFRFEFKPVQPMSTESRMTYSDISNLSVDIANKSRAKEKDEIVDALMEQANKKELMVLPIVGMGGLGKTTLAKLIYNDQRIQTHFQLRLWVCVSDNFKVDSLEKRILEAAAKEKNDSATSGTSTLDSIKGVVNGKRYLLVLDDVWKLEDTKWKLLKSYLQHGGRGCSVLTTTRNANVARLMGTTEACDLKILENSYIKEIIESRAFDSSKERPDALVKMVDAIVNRCAGSPLAASALGSVLRTKTNEDEWKAIINRSILCDEENGILPILKLSYNSLPPYMRQCFAFCAMFPKDYEISVEILIQLWMASGLIPVQQGLSPEIIGQQIFNELASRSFFHKVKYVSLDRNPSPMLEGHNRSYCSRITYKIHDLMHDVALSAMGKECAAIATELSSKDFPHSARHLYLSVHKPDTLLNDSRERGSPAIQTLICEGDVNEDLKHLSKYKYIRALKTQQCSFIKPKYLRHLRYLDISESSIEALPEDLTILYHLETLNLSGCRYLDRLPKQIKYMNALRHLYTNGCLKLKSMPAHLGDLTSLRTLTWFIAGTAGSDCSNLKQLCQLDLGGQLELRRLENVTEADATEADLGTRKKLTELALRWIDHGKETWHNHKKVLESLRPHDGLEILSIHSYWGDTFPAWMSSLQGMLELELSDCKNIKKLPPIWMLPSLQVLRLSSLDNLRCLCTGNRPFIFQKLEELTLSDMPNFETWCEVHVEEPIFPQLAKLSIWKCERLTTLPRSSDGVDTVWCSAFPKLKEQESKDLGNLATLQKWVTGPLVAMVKEKACSYLLHQYQVMEGMEEQHEVLKRKLPAILDIITDAEEQAAAQREGAKAWLEALRKVAYQANDVFDEFMYEALRRQAKVKGHYKPVGMDVIKLFPSHNRVAFRHRMGNNLGMILNGIEVLIAGMVDFGFRSRPRPQISTNRSEIVHDIIEPMNIASSARADEKQKVVKALLAQASNVNLTVLPIVGMGGMGKTTLAQLIYNDPVIQRHFQLRLWVCVSQNFDVISLARSIVEEATKENSASETSGAAPLVDLQKVVNGKRFLLVLDDVWNPEVDKWEMLKSCLQYGGIGSSVLTTTRNNAVARMMGTTEAYFLRMIDERFIMEIFQTRAIGSREESHAELFKMAGYVEKIAASSPLAARALVSVLRANITVDEWKAVLSISKSFDEENGVLPILNLSYNCLPSHIRQCFAFCAMFPKGYEIDVEMLIQLWIANGFIPEQHGEYPQWIGEHIFKELVSRSFFQDVKVVPFGEELLAPMVEGSKHMSSSRMTCKIHDLMHDVAQSATGKECVAIDTRQSQSQSEDFLYSARHLFLSVEEPETILNSSLKKGSPAIQTLICEVDVKQDLQHLSKYSSLRALKFKGGSFPNPKYLHHLRYLDLSDSLISALSEDICTLYNLQTLNLSGCCKLERLPKGIKYMSALRHLYTHGCSKLNSMPSGFGHLSSLKTLTCFVAGPPGSGCSKVGELGRLDDLGGHLELRQLENVTGEDAKAVNLENKYRLSKLTLRWNDSENNEEQNSDKKLLEGLKPHHDLKVLRIYSYRGRTCPSWMNMLQGTEVLELSGCKWLDELPALCQLPALQVLCLRGLESLCFFCSGSTLFPFKELRVLILSQMPKLGTLWDTNEGEAQGEEPIFPQLENLSIEDCNSLVALLPKAFPALKEIKLCSLEIFQRWEANEGTQGEGGVKFPLLEKLNIQRCQELTILPEAPKLSVLEIDGGNQQISLQAASRYITSLSKLELNLAIDDRETTLQAEPNSIEFLHDMVKSNHIFPMTALELGGCNLLFPHASAQTLWAGFAQLVDLKIRRCDALIDWPYEVFQNLVSLRTLQITGCSKLKGHTQASEPPVIEWSGILPCLESLEIIECESFVEVPHLPASLKNLLIKGCNSCKYIVFGQREDTRLVSADGDVCLKSLTIKSCGGLIDVDNLPPSIRTMNIDTCSNLEFLSGQLDALQILRISSCSELKTLEYCLGELLSLEQLELHDCKSLVSLPNGRQTYSSLRVLRIESCSGVKLLPSNLRQRLDHLEEKTLDARYEEPKTWKYRFSRMSHLK